MGSACSNLKSAAFLKFLENTYAYVDVFVSGNSSPSTTPQFEALPLSLRLKLLSDGGVLKGDRECKILYVFMKRYYETAYKKTLPGQTEEARFKTYEKKLAECLLKKKAENDAFLKSSQEIQRLAASLGSMGTGVSGR